jgi:hypothetical protein
MKTYARMQDGRVMELVTTGADVGTLYHPSLVWMDVSSVQGVALGWHYDGARWSAPEAVPAASPIPSIADLQSHLALLGGQIAALSKHG